MADVFISYSRHDRALAEGLAEYLRARDIDVWWDSELYAGAQFHDVIRSELEKATAVIVIWSAQSVQSIWVVGEAQLAANSGKLVCALAPDFPASDIPKNHLTVHAESIDNRERIVRALEQRGVTPATSIVQGLDKELIVLSRSTLAEGLAKRKAFICYALDDRRHVQAAACAYEAGNEITVFQDFGPIPPGTALNDETKIQLVAADYFILFWSRAAARSEAVSRELDVLSSHLVTQRLSGTTSLALRIVILEKRAPLVPELFANLSDAQQRSSEPREPIQCPASGRSACGQPVAIGRPWYIGVMDYHDMPRPNSTHPDVPAPDIAFDYTLTIDHCAALVPVAA